MKTYEVVARVTITKTYTVTASSHDAAIEAVFDAGIDLHNEPGVSEKYDEQIIRVTEIPEEL